MSRHTPTDASRVASQTEKLERRASYASELSQPQERPPHTPAKSGIFDRELDMASAGVAERTTHAEFGERKLSLLCEGLGLSHQRRAAIELFRLLTKDWSQWPLEDKPSWKTDITDDGTPFEFSVAFDGSARQVRILVESQEDPIGPLSSWSAGLRLNQRLKTLPGVDLERFELVRDLFTPDDGASLRFTLWHGASLNADGSAAFKIYVNPQVRGPRLANGIVRDALRRLSLGEAAQFLLSHLRSRRDRNSFIYFSLDLSSGRAARAKVYIAHEHATAAEVDAALEGCRDHVPGDASRWIAGLLGNMGTFDLRPILTCYSFSSAGGIPRATVHVPVRCYVRSDAEAVDQASKFLASQHATALQSGLSRVSGYPLDRGRGSLTYVSFKRRPGGTCVTTYVAPQAYEVNAPLPARNTPSETRPKQPPFLVGGESASVRWR